MSAPILALSIGCVSLIAQVTTARAQIPDAIKASAGEAPMLTIHAEGAQIYECKVDPKGKLNWQFREPIAALMIEGKTVGRHFAGPNWELDDGSAVGGKVISLLPIPATETSYTKYFPQIPSDTEVLYHVMVGPGVLTFVKEMGEFYGSNRPQIFGFIDSLEAVDVASPGLAFWAFVPLQLVSGLLMTFVARESLYHARAQAAEAASRPA